MKDKNAEEGEAYLKQMEVYFQARDDWKKQKLKQLFSKQYKAELMGNQWKEIKEYETSLDDTIREQGAQKHNNLYLWLTVNPKPDVDFCEFESKVRKAVERTMFKEYLFVYEQRGKDDTTIGDGFHAHILLKRNLDYKPSKIITNLKNTFKDITDVNRQDIFNYKWIGEEFKNDKVEYITGLKTGEGKDEKQNMDILWRKYNDLEVFYGNIEI